MKKILALSLTAAMVAALSACGSSSQTSTASTSETSSASSAVSSSSEAAASSSSEATSSSSEAAAFVVGGWTIAEDNYNPAIDSTAAEVFDKAFEAYLGESFEPLALLGTQVVSGTNYMYFCKGTMSDADATQEYAVVTVYNDLENNAEVSNVVSFDLNTYCSSSDSQGTETGLAGGWTVVEPAEAASLPSDIQKVFDSALEGFTGAGYTPVALLATQVVSGTNYAFLCTQTLVTADPVTNYAVVTIYNTLDDQASIQSINALDLAAFNE